MTEKKAKKADGEAAVLAKIAAMPAPYGAMGERLHALILRSAPGLQPTFWYGMPAYAKDGKVICFFRADKYMTFGLSENANHALEEGAPHQLRESSWFLTAIDEATEARLSAIVRKAASCGGARDGARWTKEKGNEEEKMNDRDQYTPGPASGAEARKDGEKWTLILVRELRHSPEKVWQALTDPAHLREWAPFDADGSLGSVGSVKLTWVGTQATIETRVTRADAPKVLEYDDTRWELEALGGGTRLTLWHKIDRRFISMGAAGWHISFDVLDRLLSGTPIGRIAGAEAMKFGGWQRLNAEYARQFGVETPGWAPKN